MPWFWLTLAGVLEIVWALGLKQTQGFTRFWPSVITITALVASFILLGVALKHIPVGTGYAVWVGIGAAGTALLSIILFGEPATWPRLACIGLIVSGVIGLKLVSGAPPLQDPAILEGDKPAI